MEHESRRGTELKEQREKLGLSQEDVFRKIRIPLDFIRQLETGRLDEIVADTYTIGFVKTYCEMLGINPELYIAELCHARVPAQGIIGHANEVIHADPSERPRWLSEALMWAAIIAIIVLGWATYSVVIQPAPADVVNQVQADSIDMRVPEFPMR